MIYMDPLQLGWEPLVTTWMNTEMPDSLKPDQKETIRVRTAGQSINLSYINFKMKKIQTDLRRIVFLLNTVSTSRGFMIPL